MIKKRNLDPSLKQWIMTVTGLGPGLGELKWVAPANSTTSQFKAQLTDNMGITDKIYANPTSAEADMTGYRNDVMLVAPGIYAQTASLTWDKPNTHILGLAGPNNGGDYGDASGVNMYSTTTDVAQILDISAKTCMFINVNFQNNGANAACLAAVKLDAVGNYFRGCNIMGCMAATQAATALACSLWIRGGGMYPIFENCNIGHQVWTTRSGANQGVILFNESNTQANGGQFRNCNILSVCETATGAFISVVGNNVLGRGWTFDNCVFDNYTTGTRMNQAVYESATNSINDRVINMKNSYLNTKGCDAWQDADNGTVHGSMAIANVAGGLSAEISAAT